MVFCASCIVPKSWRKFPRTRWRKKGRYISVPSRRPRLLRTRRLVEFSPAGADLTENFRALLAAPAIASKRWIWEQYDYMVRTNTLEAPGAGDAAVVRIKGTKRALALSSDGNGRWCRLDPFVGAQLAVAEAARNVACSGARPMAATNCLNFGSPEKPEVMWQFSRAIDGIAEACTALEIPITGGNVSFYNETLGRSIDPTPVLGVLGMIEDASRALGMAFRAEGDVILLLDGDTQGWGVLVHGGGKEFRFAIPTERGADGAASLGIFLFGIRSHHSRHRSRRSSRCQSCCREAADRAAGRAR